MIQDEIREAGYNLTNCNGNRHCSSFPHEHAVLWEGGEYCPTGGVILLTSNFVYSMAKDLPRNNPCNWLCSVVAEAFLDNHPDWPLGAVVILKEP